MRLNDLTGQRFGRWTVQWTAGILGKRVLWLCLCDCGTMRPVATNNLINSASKSCGCLQKEAKQLQHAASEKVYTEYRTWAGMIQRCTNPNNSHWKHYGGRGIQVCDRWRIFENFLADLGPRSEGTSIGRFGDEGNYEPGNCSWQTQAEQVANRRKRVLCPA